MVIQTLCLMHDSCSHPRPDAAGPSAGEDFVLIIGTSLVQNSTALSTLVSCHERLRERENLLMVMHFFIQKSTSKIQTASRNVSWLGHLAQDCKRFKVTALRASLRPLGLGLQTEKLYGM